MRKCPLCDKKIPGDAKFCPECGWDLAEHELSMPQIARIQEEIQYARFRVMEWAVAEIPVVTIGVVCILLSLLANLEVIPARWEVTLYVALPFILVLIPFAFLRDRYRKKQERLRMMLRERRTVV
jgi:hypothetical protein